MATQGRPTIYTQELADEICEHLVDGLSLREVFRLDGMPSEGAVRRWASEDREGIYAQYAKARAIGYMAMSDEVLEIADNGANDWMERNEEDNEGWEANGEHLQRSRLRVETRKWLLSKVLPKTFGDKLALGGADDLPAIKTEETSAADLIKSYLDQISKHGTETRGSSE